MSLVSTYLGDRIQVIQIIDKDGFNFYTECITEVGFRGISQTILDEQLKYSDFTLCKRTKRVVP